MFTREIWHLKIQLKCKYHFSLQIRLLKIFRLSYSDGNDSNNNYYSEPYIKVLGDLGKHRCTVNTCNRKDYIKKKPNQKFLFIYGEREKLLSEKSREPT